MKRRIIALMLAGTCLFSVPVTAEEENNYMELSLEDLQSAYAKLMSDYEYINEEYNKLLAEKNIETKETEVAAEINEKSVKKIDMEHNQGKIKFKKFELTTDYDGKPAIIVYYDYTNLMDEAEDYAMMFYTQVFQNGVECEIAFIDSDNEALKNAEKDIQKDTTLEIAVAHVLEDTENPVTIKISDMSDENWLDDIYQEMIVDIKE